MLVGIERVKPKSHFTSYTVMYKPKEHKNLWLFHSTKNISPFCTYTVFEAKQIIEKLKLEDKHDNLSVEYKIRTIEV